MEITRIVNNNVICAVGEQGQELVLLGNGIGFQKKRGDEVDRGKIEKEFFLKSKNATGKLYALLDKIPMEYMSVSESIIRYAKEVLGKELNENIYITLTDHIYFAIVRYSDGLPIKNALLWEIKKFYNSEYKVALKGLEIIKEKLNVDLPEDEAGFIALHIVNAEYGSEMEETLEMTRLIQKVLNVVRYEFIVQFNEDSLNYMRLITHLKFFAYRLFSDSKIEGDDVDFQEIIKAKYKNEYQCSMKIAELVKKDYQKQLTEEELMYLTVHIKRVISENLST